MFWLDSFMDWVHGRREVVSNGCCTTPEHHGLRVFACSTDGCYTASQLVGGRLLVIVCMKVHPFSSPSPLAVMDEGVLP